MKYEHKPLILASGSPQRANLLKQMGIIHDILPQDIDETFITGNPVKEAERLASEKVKSLLNSRPGVWGLGADTFVILRSLRPAPFPGASPFPGHHILHPQLLGKPENRDKAREMLALLSGKTQSVITGLAVALPSGEIITTSVTSKVRFAGLSSEVIEWYLDTGEWMGAAGGYRIQGKGACLIESLKGSYSNVMGLPIRTLYGILHANNYPMY